MKEFSPIQLPESLTHLIEKLTGSMPEETTTVSLEYCTESVANLLTGSKACYVMMNAYIFENKPSCVSIRKQLLESGKIEAVILTPSRLFDGTGISVSILVMSDNNSGSVMMVNASKIFHEESRAKAILTDEDIEKIVNACTAETDFSKKVSISEIAENGYSLSPLYYTKPELKNPVKFGELVKSYRCGLQLSPEKREALTSDIATGWQYVQPKNIINGEIDSDLPYLNECRESFLNHQIKNGNIVIAKLGSPLKVTVAEFEEKQTVIGVGRLYIFDIDTEKAEPHKIKKFLSSSLGQSILDSCNTSILVKNLTIDRILGMSVPYDEVKIE